MANEIRVRSSFKSGIISDNPLSNSATTLNSTNLAGLPAIGATEHCALILDPTGVGNGPEVVWVTAHTGSATSATIVRGREGTSGVQHASTIAWVHAPTHNDFTQTGTTASRPSGTGIPFRHQRYYDTTVGAEIVYSGSEWMRAAPYTKNVNYLNAAELGATSTSYASIDGTNLTTSFVKVAGNSDLIVRVMVNAVAWNTADPGLLTVGMRVDATDYDVCRSDLSDFSANLNAGYIGGERTLTGISAGTYTCLPRWKIASAAGGAYYYVENGSGSVSFSITETGITS